MDTDWTFPGMSTGELVERRDELHRYLFQEHVAASRADLRRAILRINECLLDRRGYVYSHEDTWRIVVHGWLMVVPGRAWSTRLPWDYRGEYIGGDLITFTGLLTDGHLAARTQQGHEYVWVGA